MGLQIYSSRFKVWDSWVSAGDWIGPTGGSVTTTTRLNGFAFAVPIYQPGRAIDQLQIEVVTTPGSAGSVHRLGAYQIGSDRIPRLIAEAASTVDTTATGVLVTNITIPAQLRWIWLVAIQQGAPSTNATIRVTNNFIDGMPHYGTGTAVTTAASITLGSGVTGVLPASFAALGTNLNTNSNGPYIRARLA